MRAAGTRRFHRLPAEGVNLDDRALDPAEIERRQAAVSVFADYLAEQSKPAVRQEHFVIIY